MLPVRIKALRNLVREIGVSYDPNEKPPYCFSLRDPSVAECKKCAWFDKCGKLQEKVIAEPTEVGLDVLRYFGLTLHEISKADSKQVIEQLREAADFLSITKDHDYKVCLSEIKDVLDNGNNKESEELMAKLKDKSKKREEEQEEEVAEEEEEVEETTEVEEEEEAEESDEEEEAEESEEEESEETEEEVEEVEAEEVGVDDTKVESVNADLGEVSAVLTLTVRVNGRKTVFDLPLPLSLEMNEVALPKKKKDLEVKLEKKVKPEKEKKEKKEKKDKGISKNDLIPLYFKEKLGKGMVFKVENFMNFAAKKGSELSLKAAAILLAFWIKKNKKYLKLDKGTKKYKVLLMPKA